MAKLHKWKSSISSIYSIYLISYINILWSISLGLESNKHKIDQNKTFLETVTLIIANKIDIRGSSNLVYGKKNINKADITIPIDYIISPMIWASAAYILLSFLYFLLNSVSL